MKFLHLLQFSNITFPRIIILCNFIFMQLYIEVAQDSAVVKFITVANNLFFNALLSENKFCNSMDFSQLDINFFKTSNIINYFSIYF